MTAHEQITFTEAAGNTYEQHTIDGTIEILDEHTEELVARKMLFTCEKDCRLCGEEFMEGEEIEVIFPPNLKFSSGQGKNGPWYPGEYTSRWLRNRALEIKEVSRGKLLYSRSMVSW